MTQEERAFILEMNELMIESYREQAAKIASQSQELGFHLASQAPESAYTAQVHVAWLGDCVLSRIIPVLEAVADAVDIAPMFGEILNSHIERNGVEMDVAELRELASNLQSQVSKAATANGLPACHYYRQATIEELDALREQGEQP